MQGAAVIVGQPGGRRAQVLHRFFGFGGPAQNAAVVAGGKAVDVAVAVADDLGGDVESGLGRAGKAVGKAAAVKGAKTAGAVPACGGLEIVVGEQDVAAVYCGVKGAVPPGLARKGADGKAVLAPAEGALLGQQAVGGDGFERQPGDVVEVAVL